MTLYLDSADVDEARAAAELSLVWGITTNPSLMAGTGREPLAVLADLCDAVDGTVFYQPTAETLPEREAEARRAADAIPGRVGLKIPCTLENLALASRLSDEGYLVGVTAIFSPAQAYLACQSGARYMLPYVNRSTRLQGDGRALVSGLRAVADAEGGFVEIIAASIKTPAEAVETVLAGAQHLTLPLSTLQAMGQHDLSDQAIEAFNEAWTSPNV